MFMVIDLNYRQLVNKFSLKSTNFVNNNLIVTEAFSFSSLGLQESMCLAAMGWLQGWAAKLLLCALGVIV